MDDDAQGIIDAIMHIKGVISVGGNIDDATLYTAKRQERYELQKKLFEILE